MTTQVKEIIIFDSKEYSLIYPLLLPDSVMQEKKTEFYRESTACWRGYVGTWEIKDDKLYLVKLSSSRYELVREPPIFANWITDKLMFTTGKTIIDEVEKYIYQTHLNVANGQIVSIKNIKEDRKALVKAILSKHFKSPNTKNKLQSFLELDDD